MEAENLKTAYKYKNKQPVTVVLSKPWVVSAFVENYFQRWINGHLVR